MGFRESHRSYDKAEWVTFDCKRTTVKSRFFKNIKDQKNECALFGGPCDHFPTQKALGNSVTGKLNFNGAKVNKSGCLSYGVWNFKNQKRWKKNLTFDYQYSIR